MTKPKTSEKDNIYHIDKGNNPSTIIDQIKERIFDYLNNNMNLINIMNAIDSQKFSQEEILKIKKLKEELIEVVAKLSSAIDCEEEKNAVSSSVYYTRDTLPPMSDGAKKIKAELDAKLTDEDAIPNGTRISLRVNRPDDTLLWSKFTKKTKL